LILLGLDAALANGANRIAIFIQNIFALYAFKRQNCQQFGFRPKLALLTLPGAGGRGIDRHRHQRCLLSKNLGDRNDRNHRFHDHPA
jgi:hypothetical protein